jgi:ribonuclease Z
MLEVCLLGTGGTVPLPERWLTSLLVRWEGKELLIDCGEGTQIAMHAHGFSCRHIDTILLTHYHADHTAGLPGILLSMAKAERTEPITIIGPKGLPEILKGVYLVARYIPFEIKYMELEEEEQEFDIDDLHMTAFHLRHSVPCYGYTMELNRKPKFDVEKAKENYVPLKAWSTLQKGQEIEMHGVTYTPDMVMGEARRGIKLVYATDTRPTASLLQQASQADLLITEGMYGDEEKLDHAKQNKHMMMSEAAELAKKADARELWFTHYSPSMYEPLIYEAQMKEIFDNCVVSKDGQRKDLIFTDEEDLCSKS